MTVYIIGAGPGDPELLTLKAARLISECPIVLYTGSLVPKEALSCASDDAQVLNSAGMTLDEIIEIIETAHKKGQDVARVHTGDPSLFGSTAEQMRRLDDLGIPYQIIPGVSSFSASAAALSKELTLPELSQTVIISRVEGRTPMPDNEKLEELARHKSTMVFFLSITLVKKLVRTLRPIYGAETPIAIVHKASCPEQVILQGTLNDIEMKVRKAKITSQSIIIVGEVLSAKHFADSRLYASDFTHKFRQAQTEPKHGDNREQR